MIESRVIKKKKIKKKAKNLLKDIDREKSFSRVMHKMDMSGSLDRLISHHTCS